MKSTLKLLILVFVLSSIAFANNYKQITTNYFKIIYNSNQQNLASYYSQNVDKWATEVFELFSYYPGIKIYIFLDDSTDIINSFAYLNTIYMFPTRNTFFDESGVDWVEPVFKHELTHNISYMYNVSTWWFFTFNTSKLLAMPVWFLEGGAVVTETVLNPYSNVGGRGVSEKHFSQERYLINNNLKNNFYYKGYNPYLDGSSFFIFYINTYGLNNYIAAYTTYLSSFVTPFIHSPIAIFAKQASVSNTELINNWNIYLSNKYKSNINTNNVSINNNNYAVTRLITTNNNNILFYGYKKSWLDGKYYSGVFSYNTTNNTIQKKANFTANIGASIEPFIEFNHKENNFLYAKTQPNQLTGSSKSKIYKHNNNIIPAFAVTDGQTVSAINTAKGLLEIQRVNDKMRLVLNNNTIIDEDKNLIFNNLKASSTNQDIVYLEAGEIGAPYIYIYELNLLNNQLSKLVKGYYPFEYNNNLYFSYALPNEQSRYNIYKYNLSSKQLVQITNHPYGAFNPVVNEDGIYFTTYNYLKDAGITHKIEYINNNSLLNIPINLQEFNATSKFTTSSNNKTYLADPLETTVSSVKFYNYKLSQAMVSVSTLTENLTPEIVFSFESLKKNHLLNVGYQVIDYENNFPEDLTNTDSDNNKYIKQSAIASLTYQPNVQVMQNMAGIPPLLQFNGYYNSKDFFMYEAKLNPLILNGNNIVPTTIAISSIDNYKNSTIGGMVKWQNYPLEFSYLLTDLRKRNQQYSTLNANLSIISGLFMFSKDKVSYKFNPLQFGDELSEVNNSDTNLFYTKDTSSLISVKLERAFNFYPYIGKADGLFGINTIQIAPLVTYVWAKGTSNTFYIDQNLQIVEEPVNIYYRSIFYALRTVTQFNLYERINVGINITAYKRVNYTLNPNIKAPFLFKDDENHFKKKNITGVYARAFIII